MLVRFIDSFAIVFIFVRTEEQIKELKAKTDSLIDEDCLDWIIPQVSLLLGAIQGLVLNLIAKFYT